MGIVRKTNITHTATGIINYWCAVCISKRVNTLVFPNVYIGPFEADIVEITKDGYAHEFEVKISRSDFHMDSAKEKKYRWADNIKKYEHLVNGDHVNSFSFVVPEGLVTVEEVPEWAGLIYAKPYGTDRYRFDIVKKAKRLSKEKHGERIRHKCLLSSYYRFHKLRTK